jgi:hypothetical protein
MVAVNPLADFFRSVIETPIYEETGSGHTVFVYGPSEKRTEPVQTGPHFLEKYPAYRRRRGEYMMEKTAYTLDSVYGAADFDAPGGAAQAGAKLMRRLPIAFPPDPAVLVYEPGQGHFPVWFAARLHRDAEYTLAGRNVLALEASRFNLRQSPQVKTFSIVDLETHRDALIREKGYDFIAAFPSAVPQTDRLTAHWDGLEALLASEGVALLGFPSAEAERFDRKKPKGFTRLGDAKKNGFRALAYRKNPLNPIP